jgi:hypothetical protein
MIELADPEAFGIDTGMNPGRVTLGCLTFSLNL